VETRLVHEAILRDLVKFWQRYSWQRYKKLQ